MKILIVKTSALGDITHVFPSIGYIKNRFPQAQIDWVVEGPFADLVKAHPHISQVYCIDTKSWRSSLLSRKTGGEILQFKTRLRSTSYDVIFDLQGNLKSGFITALAKGKDKAGFNWNTVHEKPNVMFTNMRFPGNLSANVRVENLSIIQQYFKDNSEFFYTGIQLSISFDQRLFIEHILESWADHEGPIVMVCPGSNWRNKQLAKDAWKAFLQRVHQTLNCRFMFAWGTPAEYSFCCSLKNTYGEEAIVLEKMPLPVLQNLMTKVNMVIAMDSLPLHLAGTTATRTFSVFGASSAKKYKPEGPQHGTLQGACPYGRTFDRRCPILRSCPTGLCIKGLSGDDVFNAFQAWLAERVD